MAEQSLGRGAEKDLWEESLFNIWSDLSIDYVQKVGCAAEGSQGGLPIRTRRYTVDTVGSLGCQIPIATLVKHACFVGIADCYKDNSCVVSKLQSTSDVCRCEEVGVSINNVSMSG